MLRFLNFTLVFVITFLLTRNLVYSQISIRWGLDAGMNFGNQTNTFFGNDDKASRVGFVVGGLGEIRIADFLYVQVEPRYIQKGAKQVNHFVFTSNAGIGTEEDNLLKLGYLEVPALLKARFGDGNLKPFVFAGPNIGFLLSASVESDGYSAHHQQLFTHIVDIKNQYKSLDIALDLGAGAEYQVSPAVSFLLDARYSYGLSDLNNVGGSFDPTMKSYGIGIVLGALFSL